MTAYHRIAVITDGVMLGVWVLAAVFASSVAPFDPNQNLTPFARPGTVDPDGATLWLGTDHLGRDILSRLVWAGRHNLILMGITLLLAYGLGFPLAFAAASRFRLLALLPRSAIAIARAIPVFITYVVLSHGLGFYTFHFVIAFVFASLPNLADTLAAWRQTHDENGGKQRTTRWIFAALAVDGLRRFAFYAAIAEGIAFLGFGPLPPPLASFGSMVYESKQMTLAFPHMIMLPIAALATLLCGALLLAAGLEGLLPLSARAADPARSSHRPTT